MYVSTKILHFGKLNYRVDIFIVTRLSLHFTVLLSFTPFLCTSKHVELSFSAIKLSFLSVSPHRRVAVLLSSKSNCSRGYDMNFPSSVHAFKFNVPFRSNFRRSLSSGISRSLEPPSWCPPTFYGGASFLFPGENSRDDRFTWKVVRALSYRRSAVDFSIAVPPDRMTAICSTLRRFFPTLLICYALW